jgi:DNA-3-methyladenine glycosylase II
VKPRYWPEAKDELARRDPVLAKLIAAYPDASLRTRGDPFQTLCRSIVGQQISVAAAATIWGRFETALGKVTPASVVVHDEGAMRGHGLSRQKIAYLKDLAGHFHAGTLSATRWRRLDDEAIIGELTQVKGIGRWSAEMFLIFYLMRPDVLPVGDLGLQRAMEKHYNRGRTLTRERMQRIGKPWKPWSSVATWYLWRSLDPVPVEY